MRGKKKTPRLLLAAAFLLAFPGMLAPSYAQKKKPAITIYPYSVDDDIHADANVLDMFVTNHGSIAFDIANLDPGLLFPKGSDKNMAYAAGLCIGAKVSGELRMAIAEYETEFAPGIMVGPNPEDPGDPRFRVYKITTGDGPGSPDWDAWPIADGAPTDESGNPLLLGDQTLWAVFNDADPAVHTARIGSTNPLGLEVQLTVFAYRWPDALGKTIYVKYRIINKGGNTLDETYFTFWTDPDLGYHMDDFAGYDLTSGLGFCYNANDQDNMYRAAPPAVGFLQLQGPDAGGGRLAVTAFSVLTSINDPMSAEEFYNIMSTLTSCRS